MISKNTSIITKDLVFNNLVKSARKNTISRFILAFVILVFGIIILVSGIIANDNLYTILGSVFSATSFLYFGLAINAIIKAPKDIEKGNPEINEGDINYNYLFKEQSIEVSISNKARKKNLKYTYDSLKKVYEYQDRYELYFKEQQMLFVYKDGFKEEKSEEVFKINLEKNKKIIKNKIKDTSK